MEAISDTWDFSKPTGRTQDHDSAKLTITSRMPQLEARAQPLSSAQPPVCAVAQKPATTQPSKGRVPRGRRA